MNMLTGVVRLPVFSPQLVTPTVQNFICYEMPPKTTDGQGKPKPRQKDVPIGHPDISRQAAEAPTGTYVMRYYCKFQAVLTDDDGNTYEWDSGEAYLTGCYFLDATLFTLQDFLRNQSAYSDIIRRMRKEGTDRAVKVNYGELFMPFHPTDAIVRNTGSTYEVIVEPKSLMNMVSPKRQN